MMKDDKKIEFLVILYQVLIELIDLYSWTPVERFSRDQSHLSNGVSFKLEFFNKEITEDQPIKSHFLLRSTEVSFCPGCTQTMLNCDWLHALMHCVYKLCNPDSDSSVLIYRAKQGQAAPPHTHIKHTCTHMGTRAYSFQFGPSNAPLTISNAFFSLHKKYL